MSYTTYAPTDTLELSAHRLRQAVVLAGQGTAWLAGGVGFAVTLYLCVAWPGLMG